MINTAQIKHVVIGWSITFVLLNLVACADDDAHVCETSVSNAYQEAYNEANGLEKYDAIHSFFDHVQDMELIEITTTTNENQQSVTFLFNELALCVHTFLVDDIIHNSTLNGTRIELSNGMAYRFILMEKWTALESASLQIDPHEVNPLCAEWKIKMPEPAFIHMKIFGKYGEASNLKHTFTTMELEQAIPILGLYQDYTNMVEITFNSIGGFEFFKDTLTIETDLVTAPTSAREEYINLKERRASGMNLVSSRALVNGQVPYIFDEDDELRWVLDYRNRADLGLDRLFYDVGINRLNNGNWYFGDGTSHKIYEIGLLGNVVDEWDLSPYFFHHTVVEKNDGNLLVTATLEGSTHLTGKPTVEDYLLEIDRISKQIIHVWDLKESLDENRTSYVNNLSANKVDWFHANSLFHDETDNTIIVSGRHQAVAKLTFDNQVKWIMSPHAGWNQNRQGVDLNEFLLQPLDKNGNPITDIDILEGKKSHSDFEWNWGQHAVHKIENGKLIMYDNGFNRYFSIDNKFSRIAEYEIDEENMTIQQTWSFGESLAEPIYSFVVSNVQYDVQTDHYFMNSGYVNSIPGVGVGGNMMEINRATKEVIYHADVNPPAGFAFHRVQRLKLYPE